MKIVIQGEAQAQNLTTGEVLNDSEQLQRLDGIPFAAEKCEEYLSDELFALGIIGGEITLRYTPDDALGLRVETSYHAPRKLKKSELQMLLDETTAQWSDGIGEGTCEPAEELGIDVNISPIGSSGSEASAAQFDDGVVVKKPRKNELLELLNSRVPSEEQALEIAKRGAALQAKDRSGKTALDLACQNVLPNLVALLLRRGLMKDIEDRNSPLTWLAYCPGPDEKFAATVSIARQLTEHGSEIDCFDEYGRTPLMMAVNRGNLPLTEHLLDAGANINAQTNDEDNQLSVLMHASSIPMAQFLLERGADPSIPTAYGKNAYEYQLMNSHQRGYKQMAELIQSYMPS